MIDLDIIKWLAKTLSETEDISMFTLEYTTALLMNLSLRTAGKQKCERLDIISTLSDLLEHENPRVRVFIVNDYKRCGLTSMELCILC